MCILCYTTLVKIKNEPFQKRNILHFILFKFYLFCGTHASDNHGYNVGFYSVKVSIQCSFPMCYPECLIQLALLWNTQTSFSITSMAWQVQPPYEPGSTSKFPVLILKYQCLPHVGTLHSLQGDI